MKVVTPFLVALLLSIGGSVYAQESIVDTIAEGCATEIENYCSQVSVGEGRMLACFYAHEDKLSGQCQYALYSAANTLEQAVNALKYVATQCESDIKEYCAQVQMGEGRILECLRSNAESVSPACTQAVNDVFE
jgi:hypothetical protein